MSDDYDLPTAVAFMLGTDLIHYEAAVSEYCAKDWPRNKRRHMTANELERLLRTAAFMGMNYAVGHIKDEMSA